LKINNAKFKEARERFTEIQGVGVNVSRAILADAAGLRSIQRIIDYETDPEAGAGPLVVKALADMLECKPEDITVQP
jgi:hypothetical protein